MPEDSICSPHTIVDGAHDPITDIGNAIIIDEGQVVIVVAQSLQWNAMMKGIQNHLYQLQAFVSHQWRRKTYSLSKGSQGCSQIIRVIGSVAGNVSSKFRQQSEK
jgi:hypothetical protein